jgi:hypothetical protein
MALWQANLNGDPIPWLLEPETPSVQYWTLVDILELPKNDPRVREARAAIPNQSWIREWFSLQHPEGHWGDQASPYRADGAVTLLTLLHMYGVTPDERTRAGCNAFLQYGQNPCGGFSLIRNIKSGIFPCTTGEHLPFLIYFGLGDDPRIQKAFEHIINAMDSEQALNCPRYNRQPCLWGAIAALKGLAVLPEALRTPRTEGVVARLAAALLDAPYDFEGEHKRWLKFGVPRAWDLLSALQVLAVHGFGREGRFSDLLTRVLETQDETGRWFCGTVSRTWPLEKRNQPSKWVTLNALRLLKQVS